LLNLLTAGHYGAIHLGIVRHLAKASTPLGGKGLQRRPARAVPGLKSAVTIS
jgi:hypothetical protein